VRDWSEFDQGILGLVNQACQVIDQKLADQFLSLEGART